MTDRTAQRIIPSVAATEGAGVRIRRSLGSAPSARHDPFLMLDEFHSDNPDDYVAGFPAHPHRGFETVTYMLDGHLRHEDNLGNRGDLSPGDVQWMTAARGIIHSEMPQQAQGRMRGFQLWLNLPAAEKMKPAAWRDIPAREIPAVTLADGVVARVIAGSLEHAGGTTRGPVNGQRDRSTDPLYFDLQLPGGAAFTAPLPAAHSAFVYVYEGAARVGDRELPPRAAALLSEGDRVTLTAGPSGARLLLLAAKPLREPVVQYGPFVMNTDEEIHQAIADYQGGRLSVPVEAPTR